MPNRITEAIGRISDALRIRIKPSPSPYSDVPIAKKGNMLGDILEDLEGSSLVDISQLNRFRTLSDDRDIMYTVYDEMSQDSVIASALEMYADDSTQYDTKGRIIWAESQDSDIAAYANRLIDILGLNRDAWSHIYSMVKYGDLYIETFKDDEKDDDPLVTKNLTYTDIKVREHKVGSFFEEYIEAVHNPAEIFDITKRGKTIGYVKIPESDQSALESRTIIYNASTKNANDIYVMPSDKYIHFTLATNTDRFPEKIELTFDGKKEGEATVKSYYINRGKSVLHDIYKIYREMQLMEDAILLNRVTRSSIIRLLQIEVGDMPKNQSRELLKRVKQIIEQKNFMDKNDGVYKSMASPGPIDNVIYIPTHNGKGQISAANLGGDVDIKSIVDLEYFREKLCGALKIPYAFLFGTANENGLGGGTSLVKMSARYARTIKRVQNAYISGVTTLINLFAINRGLTDYVNNFTIKMVSPSTAEDQEHDEMLDNRINMTSGFMDLLSSEVDDLPKLRRDILKFFINDFIGEPEIGAILDQYPVEDEDIDLEDTNDEGFSNSSTDNSLGNIDMDIDLDTDIGSDEDIEVEEPTSTEPANNDEFGNFENEF